MNIRNIIYTKLSRKFTPVFLDVVDESNKHFGHAGWREGGETHFRIRIAADYLAGMSRVAQHRAIMETLDAELNDRVHALAIDILPLNGPWNLSSSP